VGVLVSGSGSNLQALIDDIAGGAPYSIALVLSNKAGVKALERAEKAGIPAQGIPHKDFADRPQFEDALVKALREKNVEVVMLAGFMRILTSNFLDAFSRAVVNVHPALCPAFPGMHGARQALDYGARITGCTVHLVDAGVDTGPILAQAAVPIFGDDDEEKLQKRIQIQEHKMVPRVLRALAEGRIVVPADGAAPRWVDADCEGESLSWR
jgi:phosphoribosylglycinamide formyltransferase-1